MLYRNTNGVLIEINKYDYKNDIIYYNEIINKVYNKNNNNNNKNNKFYTNEIINQLTPKYGSK